MDLDFRSVQVTRRLRTVFLVVLVFGCLAIPGADAQEAVTTASGTVLNVSQPQVVSQMGDDGTVTDCAVFGGTLRTTEGQNVNFAAGGVLTRDSSGGQGNLDSEARAIVETLQRGAQQGLGAVVTISYVATRALCGHSLSKFVTSASLTAAPPTQQPTPGPTPPPAPPAPQPIPTTRTALGRVTAMSAVGVLIGVQRDGITSICRIWPGAITTKAGQRIDFVVETGLTVSPGGDELLAVDPSVTGIVETLQLTGLYGGPKALVRITYTGPVVACGKSLPAVVTVVTANLPKHKKRGRITRISSPAVVSRNGMSCKIWKGSLKTQSGSKFNFAVETSLTGSPPRPADPRAERLANTLRKARAKRTRAVTTITYSGPIAACGKTLSHVVAKASARGAPRHHG